MMIFMIKRVLSSQNFEACCATERHYQSPHKILSRMLARSIENYRIPHPIALFYCYLLRVMQLRNSRSNASTTRGPMHRLVTINCRRRRRRPWDDILMSVVFRAACYCYAPSFKVCKITSLARESAKQSLARCLHLNLNQAYLAFQSHFIIVVGLSQAAPSIECCCCCCLESFLWIVFTGATC